MSHISMKITHFQTGINDGNGRSTAKGLDLAALRTHAITLLFFSIQTDYNRFLHW